MLGQIVWDRAAGRKIKGERRQVLGLTVFRVTLSPDGRWARRRLKKAGRILACQTVSRVLVPEGFDGWKALEAYGLKPVEATSFLRVISGHILLAALRRNGLEPKRCAVALRGRRTERDMTLAAQALAPNVRSVVVSAPVGGENLIRWLQRQWGIAPQRDRGDVDGVICFDEHVEQSGRVVITLSGDCPDLAGVTIALRGGGEESEETQKFPLLTALWETGRISVDDLEIS